MIVRLFVVLALVVCGSCSNAEDTAAVEPNDNASTPTGETITIPLSEIWAQRMPGTKSIRDLEGKSEREGTLIGEISKKHGFGTWEAQAGPAFAVAGTGLEALKNAHAMITGKQPPPTSLRQAQEISIIFFSIASNNYVHLTKVERNQNTIKIKYEFVPHTQNVLTRHFAIIPLGKLPRGQFTVDIAAEPFAQRFLEEGWREIPDEKKLPRVSSSFEFNVQ